MLQDMVVKKKKKNPDYLEDSTVKFCCQLATYSLKNMALLRKLLDI